jgi:hypothetical protein
MVATKNIISFQFLEVLIPFIIITSIVLLLIYHLILSIIVAY